MGFRPNENISTPLTRYSINAILFVAWVTIVSLQIVNHVMWRDEPRALWIALGGENLIEMLKGLHGEGHPAIWYLVLRAAYGVVGRVEVLPAAAAIVGAGAVALLIFRSPFPRLLVAGLAFGNLLSYEYSVVARNYGLSALLLLLIAAAYEKRRDSGLVLGLLLFLLANTNVVGALMVGAFLLFWLLDVLAETGLRWTLPLRAFVLNAGVATVGVAVCGLTILPTVNDAATQDLSHVPLVLAAVMALVNPGGGSFSTLAVDAPSHALSALLFAAPLGLLPRRAAFASAWFALIGMTLFFALAAAGAERHAGVWLFFIVALYWIAWKDVTQALFGIARRPVMGSLAAVGTVGFGALVAIQAANGLRYDILRIVQGVTPESRSADLARLIASRSDLAHATILADPDYLVEALPYYLANRTYLIRRHSFGNVVIFSRAGELTTTLGEILDDSRKLKQTTGAPVIILLMHRLDQITPDQPYKEGYNWTFVASAEQIRQFTEATKLLARFAPARTDESYDAYVLE